MASPPYRPSVPPLSSPFSAEEGSQPGAAVQRHHDLSATTTAWPLYSPSASLSCKSRSGELHTIPASPTPSGGGGGGTATEPSAAGWPHHATFLAAPSLRHHGRKKSYGGSPEFVTEPHHHHLEVVVSGGGNKSEQQREKDDDYEAHGRWGVSTTTSPVSRESSSVGAPAGEVVVCLRENKLKAESDLEQLHTSRGTPIPTRRKKAPSGASAPTSPRGPLGSSPTISPSPLAAAAFASGLGSSRTVHFNNLPLNNMEPHHGGSTADIKQRQYEQFLAMAKVMKGDSFDTIDEISPPTSPRFLSISTGSGLMGIKSQHQRYHNNGSRSLIEGSSAGCAAAGSSSVPAPKSHSRLPNRHESTAAAGAGGRPSTLMQLLRQRQHILLWILIVCITSGFVLLTASHSASSRIATSRSPSRVILSPDEVDDAWFLQRDRQRGRIKDDKNAYADDPSTDYRPPAPLPVEDEQDPLVPVDESYKYRDYPFLLHNALPRVARNGTVIMVIANSGYLEVLLNWKAFMDKLNITNYIILPVDVQVAQQLTYLGVDWAYDPEIGMDALSQTVVYTISKESPGYAKWNKVVHKKSHYFRRITELGYSVMVSDIDMVWLQNPFLKMSDDDVDIFFTNDWNKPNKAPRPTICGGLFYGKNREKSLSFINHVIDCETGKQKKEQHCMNMWLDAVDNVRKPENDIDLSPSEVPRYKIMSMNDFPSGGYYFGQDWRGTEKPYVIHNNWVIGKIAKIRRFKTHRLWLVDDASLNNLMINFRYDEHRGRPERGREGEAADELMVYHTEMRKRFGKFDDGVWLLERQPTFRLRPACTPRRVLPPTPASDSEGQLQPPTKPDTPASGSSSSSSSRKVVVPKREPVRNPNYKYIDGSRNPHYTTKGGR